MRGSSTAPTPLSRSGCASPSRWRGTRGRRSRTRWRPWPARDGRERGPSAPTWSPPRRSRCSAATASRSSARDEVLSPEETRVVLFTLGVAALATLVILPPGVAAALLLACYRRPGKGLLETLLSLPLVLPST